MLWLLLCLIVAVFMYLKVCESLKYWGKKKLPHDKPWLLVGNMAPCVFGVRSFAYVLQDAYEKYSDHRYFGFYQFSTPYLVIRDPDLIKQICIKDFDKFTDRTDFLPEDSDTFWKRSLGAMSGQKWHEMRTVLSLAFTSSKMKAMFCLMNECAEEFVKNFEHQREIITVDTKDVFTRLANDVIASTAFGIKCDSMKEKNNEFYLMGKGAFDLSGFKGLKFFGYHISPTLMKWLKITFISKTMANFFCDVVKQTIKHREETGLVRPDMIHLLREAQKGRLRHEDDFGVADSGFAVAPEFSLKKNSHRKKVEISEEDIAAQGVLFYFAGFDTVALLLCHVAYELALNPEVQERLLEEVDTTLNRCGGKITYEALLNMLYLDMVVSETLRLWSAAVVLNRRVGQTCTIQPKSSKEEPLVLEVGTDCIIPIFAIHRDPKYFFHPYKFDPERFSNQNKKQIKPYTYLPFGVGPRNCIGNRFALLEVKTTIFHLLKRFRFVPVAKTSIPFVISKSSSIVILSHNGYWLGMKSRNYKFMLT